MTDHDHAFLRRLVDETREHNTAREISRLFGLSLRTVEQLIAELEAEDRRRGA